MARRVAVLLFIAAQLCATMALPPCACTRNLRPVCGSDGKTYSNQCRLDCERITTNQELTAVKDGPCEDEHQPACICTFEYRPVCGTDGSTYSNRCSLECQKARSHDLEVKYDGACAEEVKVANIPPCTCTREAKPVCGSDGKTYANDCLLNCATANNHLLSIAHRGSCSEVKVVEQPQSPQPSCACTRNLQPVCGTDGVTYNNVCLLNCSGAQLAKNAPCDE